MRDYHGAFRLHRSAASICRIDLPQRDWREGGAVDAIALACVYPAAFDRLNEDWALRKRHPDLPVPCQVGVAQITGGRSPSLFADRVEIAFDAQYLPAERDAMGLGSQVKRGEELVATAKVIAVTLLDWCDCSARE